MALAACAVDAYLTLYTDMEGGPMKITIYLPDDFGEILKMDHPDLNISAVCQEALREEMARRNQLAKLSEGMTRVVVYLDDRGTDAAFVGRELHYDGDRMPETTVYLTRQHRLAAYDHHNKRLHQFDAFDELANAYQDRPELVAGVAKALGEKYVLELDI
jgi:post-segregation antitoxin (ccd killing protein)